MRINGKTNVNRFTCEIKGYYYTDTLIINKRDKEIILSGRINPDIQNFDCNNAMMTHDLRKTLKEKQFPKFKISFLSLNKFPDMNVGIQHITGLVDIELAGITKRLKINYDVFMDAQKVIHLLGLREVNFSDFNLIPPKRLGGMVRTRDKISVSFNLNLMPAVFIDRNDTGKR